MDKKTIYALGFFDGVHLGHRALLSACRALADQHGCRAGAVTFSQHPDALVQGNAPALITTAQERQRLMAHDCGMDVCVSLPFDEAMMAMPWQDFLGLLTEEYGAAGLVCGADFRFGAGGAGNARLLEAACAKRGMPCAVVPEQRIDGVTVSSTHIRALLQRGEVAQAARFLGHPYTVTGTVVSGRQLGRTIGVPTANLILDEALLCPRHGVYACLASFDGKQYPAVTNIGTRPTVGGSHVTVEPWLLGFDGDLYGKQLRLELHEFLRPEQKFDSLDQLREEIEKNAAQTLEFFQKL